MRKKNLLLFERRRPLRRAGHCGLWPGAQARHRALLHKPRSMPAARLLPPIARPAIQADLSGTNDAPQLAGSAFIGAWKGRTTQALLQQDQQDHAGGRAGQPG